MSFLETAKGSNFAVEDNRISKFSLNVQKLGFSLQKMVPWKKSVVFKKTVNVAELL